MPGSLPGEGEYQYHGANRLGANLLVSCIFGGFIAGPNAVNYARSFQAAPRNGFFINVIRDVENNATPLMKLDGSRILLTLARMG